MVQPPAVATIYLDQRQIGASTEGNREIQRNDGDCVKTDWDGMNSWRAYSPLLMACDAARTEG